jgi:predicted methyltransferase
MIVTYEFIIKSNRDALIKNKDEIKKWFKWKKFTIENIKKSKKYNEIILNNAILHLILKGVDVDEFI